MAEVSNRSQEIEVEGHKFHINLYEEKDISFPAHAKQEHHIQKYMILADEVIRDPRDPKNLIVGISVSYIRNIFNNDEDHSIIMYDLLTNTGELEKLEAEVAKDPNSPIFAKLQHTSNISDSELPFYRSVYPDFPVLTGSNQDKFPKARLGLHRLEINREKGSVEPFHQFVDFIRHGTLLESPELAKAMAKAIEMTIPTRQFALSGGQGAIQSDRSSGVPTLLLNNSQPQGVVDGERELPGIT